MEELKYLDFILKMSFEEIVDLGHYPLYNFWYQHNYPIIVNTIEYNTRYKDNNDKGI